MISKTFSPLAELTRGPLVESIHFGALAVVSAGGELVASVGDPELVANLRSSSKPFQALPLFEHGGAGHFQLTDQETAIMCASHHGTDQHVAVLKAIQARIGVREVDLQCGIHPAGDDATEKEMLKRGEEPTQNRHNCSGKHTGMLAQCVMNGYRIEDYLSTSHPIQQTILRTFAEMTGVEPSSVLIGIDGCSAPTFAVPLRSAALAYAHLCDPTGLAKQRACALRHIYHAMTTNPVMVSGPTGFDTRLMQAAGGMIVSKGGAEGYQAMGIAPGAIAPGSPAMGITFKVIDGDVTGRARPVISLAILRQLGALNETQLAALKDFDARPIHNWRKLEVGVIRPAFSLERVVA